MHSRCEKSPLWLTVLVLLAYFQAAVCGCCEIGWSCDDIALLSRLITDSRVDRSQA